MGALTERRFRSIRAGSFEYPSLGALMAAASLYTLEHKRAGSPT